MSRPTDGDRIEALRRFVVGLSRGDDANQLSTEIADLHVRHDTFPGEVFMELAADALQAAGAGRERPLRTESCSRRIFPKSRSEARKASASNTRSSRLSPCMAGSSRTYWTR